MPCFVPYGLQTGKVKTVIERLMYVGDVVRTGRARFEYPRDRKDERFITRAIAGEATQLVTTDRDLLDLPGGRGEASKRFRQRLTVATIWHRDWPVPHEYGAFGRSRIASCSGTRTNHKNCP